MSSSAAPFSPPALPDLTACDREPIHIPGSIQPHGFLLAAEPQTWRIRQASENVAELLGQPVEGVLGQTFDDLLGPEIGQRLRRAAGDPLFARRAVLVDELRRRRGAETQVFSLVAHRHGGHVILEGEQRPAVAMLPDTHYQLESFLRQMESAAALGELLALAARETRRVTGFDRVLVYQFDPEWNGVVVAEDRNDVLPSYLNLRFPASDIPQQARELYRLNRLRLIASADYTPVKLRALAGADALPLDLSLSTLRSVSPVHLEYMRHMGTGSSMSISLMRGPALWGLISCHSRAPRVVPFEIRTTCDLIGQVLSLQLAARENAAALGYRMRLQSLLSPLVATMARHETFAAGVAAEPRALLAIVAADGAAVVSENKISLHGVTPREEEVRGVFAWLEARSEEDVFATDSLGAVYPAAGAFAATGSGLLALTISRLRHSYVLWFRRELVATVTWGGDPTKPVEAGAAPRLHPRRSFETWKQIVHGRAAPWQQPEIDAAREFRSAVVDIVLQGAEKLAQITEDLTRTNKELENFSYTVSHDLRAPFRHIRGYAELLKLEKGAMLDAEGREFIDYVLSGAAYAGKLVDNILAFSQMGRTELQLTAVSLDDLAWDVIDDLKVDLGARKVEWDVDPLPTVQGDAAMLRTVLQNLIENAVKYTRDQPVARISVRARAEAQEHIVEVRDNGVGFDPRYKEKLFGMFQRLHRWEEFEGTGIGLASVRRIVARHGGRVWADSTPGAGATFSFSLPRQAAPSKTLYA
jgi:light-regulated signal transduction histidine kinase (bacteriophytochrome)